MQRVWNTILGVFVFFALVFCVPNAQANTLSKDELAKLEVLLASFVNGHMPTFSTAELTSMERREDLLSFVLIHIYNTYPDKAPVSKDYMTVSVNGEHVKAAVKKLFGYDLQDFLSTEYFQYKDGIYQFSPSDPGIRTHVKVTSTKELEDGSMQVQLQGVPEDAPDAKPLEYEAVVKAHVYNGENTWYAVSMRALGQE